MLSDVFNYIRTQVYQQGWKFSEISSWLINMGWPWKYLAPPFQFLRDISFLIGGYFYDAYRLAQTIEDWLSDTWDKAKQAFDYAYDVLRVRVNEALSDARDAFDYAYDAFHLADDAWDYATGWLRDKAIEAWNRAGNIWGTVTDWLKEKAVEAYNKAVWAYEQIAAAVTAAAQDIYAWVEGIPAEIKAFVDGVVADIGAVTTDIVQTLINIALAAIAGPINLVNLWFDEIQGFFTSPLDWLEAKITDWFLGPE